MTWQSFCAAFAESAAVRQSFALASKVAKGDPQNWKVRGQVIGSSGVTVQVQKKYLALTSEQVLAHLRIPAESFEELRSVTLANSDGATTRFYLFEMDDGFHTATFSSLHQLRHDELFIEPHKQLRKEQPLERYEVLLQQELDTRKPQENVMAKIFDLHGKTDKKAHKLMTLSEAQAKAQQIIENRQLREANLAAASSGKSTEEPDFDQDLEYHYAQVEKVEATVTASGAPPKTKAPKAAAKKKAAARPRGGRAKDNANLSFPRPASPARSAAPTSAGEAPGPETHDDLATVTWIGCG
eukprot:Skav207468  [mRNA]  locus=scaffold3545:474718:476046:- [translate_table: standard]